MALTHPGTKKRKNKKNLTGPRLVKLATLALQIDKEKKSFCKALQNATEAARAVDQRLFEMLATVNGKRDLIQTKGCRVMALKDALREVYEAAVAVKRVNADREEAAGDGQTTSDCVIKPWVINPMDSIMVYLEGNDSDKVASGKPLEGENRDDDGSAASYAGTGLTSLADMTMALQDVERNIYDKGKREDITMDMVGLDFETSPSCMALGVSL
ncbi:uncharacterized protein BCR38DRAFT_473793 [Pseudomassariella vexata]|uniref:Uncharacterized protein n=1 Tax=Pseudomassariella vexata TaxID=1141098 RepID=A0A1Y2E5P8_9PEZI|nr:uncharacterized protein BCR38DRAFT_473793 [Pseudomassariella vexata]ORY66606.1 hypothetical protein BCR38DRAFT_473793 [Pseudomassariella vexata]